ncbi:MAG: phosphoglycerate kinase [Myxococcales bacterium]|nr:phosphoglycerate kinase [Polyangiaceae bacterium]MDW8248648.1 phosphoglycerate kinase [Myxococcales bacterium]
MTSHPTGLRSIRDLDLARHRVLIRVDFDIPVKKGVPIDDTRIREAIPTIRLAMEAGARVILAAHRGPSRSKQAHRLSLEPHGLRLAELSGYEVHLPEDCVGDAPRKVIQDLRDGQLCLLENLVLHQGEEQNDPNFARQLAELCDLYVNDAFGVCPRAWASIQALPRQMRQRACGLQLEKEFVSLGRILDPERPLVALIGGGRLGDKLPFLEVLLDRADTLLIGGAIANTFLKARRKNLQLAHLEEDKVALVQSILHRAEKRNITVVLPTDVVVARSSGEEEGELVRVEDIPPGKVVLDIGPETRKTFAARLDRARTIYWNGPVGAHEAPPFAAGTQAMIQAICQADAFSVASGGDTLSALASASAELRRGFNHLSTAGGAVLDFLAGRKLPGIEALRT